MERRLRKEHQEWHREHDRAGRDNAVRKHNELHERIDRTREQWERTPNPRPRCEAGRGEDRTRREV